MVRVVGLARLLSSLAVLTLPTTEACTISQGGEVVNGTIAECNGPNECRGATISDCEAVKCIGTSACADAVIYDVQANGTVRCDGIDACDSTLIRAANNTSIGVLCRGQSSCAGSSDINAGDGGFVWCQEGSGSAAACQSKIASQCLRCSDVGCGGGCSFTQLPDGPAGASCTNNALQGNCEDLPPVQTPAPTPSVPEPACTASQPTVVVDVDDGKVVCDNFACQGITIENCREVQCLKTQSCMGANILNMKSQGYVKCGGVSSCAGSVIQNAVGSSFNMICEGQNACESAVIETGDAGVVTCRYGADTDDFAACKDTTIFARCLNCASNGGCSGSCKFSEQPDGSAQTCEKGKSQGDCSGGPAQKASFIVNLLTAAPAIAFLILGM